VVAGGGSEGGHAPRAALSRGGISRVIKISARVWSFRCFTTLDIRPPEVFCGVQNAPNLSPAVSPPHMHTGELPTL